MRSRRRCRTSLKTFTIERLTLAGDDVESGSRHFRLRTTESDSEANKSEEESAEERVRDKVYQAFKGNESMHLLMVSMEYSDPQAYAIEEGDESAEALLYRKFDGGLMAKTRTTRRPSRPSARSSTRYSRLWKPLVPRMLRSIPMPQNLLASREPQALALTLPASRFRSLTK